MKTPAVAEAAKRSSPRPSLTHGDLQLSVAFVHVDRAPVRHLAGEQLLGQRVLQVALHRARPLKRAVQRYLQDPLAEKLLAGEIPDGSTVRVDEGDGELKIALG